VPPLRTAPPRQALAGVRQESLPSRPGSDDAVTGQQDRCCRIRATWGKDALAGGTCRAPVFRCPVLRAMPVMILAADALASGLAACHPDCGTTGKS
jgi:hypothetical protein